LRNPRRSAVLINSAREGVIHKNLCRLEQTLTFPLAFSQAAVHLGQGR
jgi:hypothetical protein